jgi:hypothetical protein
VNRESIPVLGPEPWASLPTPARALDGPCAALSWALPLGVALWSLGGDVGFRDDLGVVRDLGFARVGVEGVVSTLLTQWAAELPLGGRALRAGLVGVLALALASRCFFDAVRGALDRRGAAASHPLLAVLTSSLWALGPAVQSEATRLGGALPAVALVMLGVTLGRRAVEGAEPIALAGSGLVFGATLAESHGAGACLAVALASLAAVAPSRAWWQGAWRLGGAGAGAFLLLASLRWVQPTAAPSLPVEVLAPFTSSLGEPAHLGFVALVSRAATLVAEEVGGVALGFALVGALIAACLASLRRAPVAWALPLALAAVGPGWLGVAPGSTPIFILLSSLGVTAFFPLGVQALVRWAWSSSLPLARPAAVLSLSFASTLVLSHLDRATMTRLPQRAAAAWTEEALGRLPPDSVLLVQSPALVLHLLASRTLHGTRPDVLLVPASLLTDSSFGRDLPRSSPSAAPLLRQLWVNGAADEYSLSHLADERPVFVELDATWDTRLLEHLRPEGLWLRYSAPELGPSERRDAPSRSRAALRRVLEAIGVEEPMLPGGASAGDDPALDDDTRRALGDALGRQALALAALAEREPARRLLRAALRIDPDNPLAAGLAVRLTEPASGRVAARHLLE